MRFAQRFLIWVVAAAVGLESFFQSLQGILDRRLDHFLLWTLAYLIIFPVAALVEKVKARGVE